jgi:hypothetical protein
MDDARHLLAQPAEKLLVRVGAARPRGEASRFLDPAVALESSPARDDKS